MKRLATIMAVAAGSLFYNAANAQVRFHINLNLGGLAARVVSAPVMVNYPQDDYSDDYYYLPEAEAYYSVPQHCYFYMDGNRWVSSAYLPGAYRDYNWQSLRHYEVRERRPYMHHNDFVNRFGGRRPGDDRVYAGRFDQRDNRGWNDQRGYDNRGGQDRSWNDQRGNDRRDNRGWGGQQDRGQYDNRQNYGQPSAPQNNGYNRGGQDRGGYNQQPQQDRGYGQQPQQGGQYQNNNSQQPQQGGQYQNSNQQGGGQGQHNGGQNGQGGQNGGQWQRGGDQQRGGQNSQPSSNQGQNDHYTSRGARNNDGDQRLAQTRTGDMRPTRFPISIIP